METGTVCLSNTAIIVEHVVEQSNQVLRNQGAMFNSTPTNDTNEKIDIVKDDKDNDQLEDSAILIKSNKNQFVHHIITHIKAADPDCKISFENPPMMLVLS